MELLPKAGRRQDGLQVLPAGLLCLLQHVYTMPSARLHVPWCACPSSSCSGSSSETLTFCGLMHTCDGFVAAMWACRNGRSCCVCDSSLLASALLELIGCFAGVCFWPSEHHHGCCSERDQSECRGPLAACVIGTVG